jgi:hypothetical protein
MGKDGAVGWFRTLTPAPQKPIDAHVQPLCKLGKPIHVKTVKPMLLKVNYTARGQADTMAHLRHGYAAVLAGFPQAPAKKSEIVSHRHEIAILVASAGLQPLAQRFWSSQLIYLQLR